MNTRMKQPWFIRTVIYSIAGLIGAVLFAIGVATPEQVNHITEQAAPLILMLISGMAAFKANPQSDLPADAAAKPTPTSVLDAIRDQHAE